MSIIEKHIAQLCKQRDFLDMYTQLCGPLPPQNLVGLYTQLHEQANKTHTLGKKEKLLPSIASFEREVQLWHPNYSTKQGFHFLPSTRLHVVIVGFLLKLDAGATNVLLNMAGMQELNGRVLLDSIFIAGLNNQWDYDDCIFRLLPTYAQTIALPAPTLFTFQDLCDYVKANGYELCDPSITDDMTYNVSLVTSENELTTYINSNKEDFRIYRDSPRRFLCQQLVEKWDSERLILTKDADTFSQEVYNIWCEVIEFYGESLSSTLLDYLESGGVLRGKPANRLFEYINGSRPISYKVFVLLLVYFEVMQFQCYDWEQLNEISAKCGFPPISREHPSAFDQVIVDFVSYVEACDLHGKTPYPPMIPKATPEEESETKRDEIKIDPKLIKDEIRRFEKTINLDNAKYFFDYKVAGYALMGLYYDYIELAQAFSKAHAKGKISQALFDEVTTSIATQQKTLLSFTHLSVRVFKDIQRINGVYTTLSQTLADLTTSKKGNAQPSKKPSHLIANPLYLRSEHDF
ncbi:hypothetical protein RFF05_13220 [Bengtsoniella intestinalis]|uniref:hypothetical protein n=1 Tax=Bengtsoniella intestinalis TaxID=3073143 RepID=UPI00391F4BE4